MAVEAINKHVNALINNLEEVDRLVDIHSQITKTGPGRRHDVEVLNKSGIVLLVACWEAYVEDLSEAVLDHMLSAGKGHSVFPDSVLERVSSAYSGKKAFELAGDGWKKALQDHKKGVLAKTVGALNTPKTAQVNDLFEKTVGLKSISSSWNWSGRTVSQSTKALDDLVSLRGSIAHRVSASKSVQLKTVRDARELIGRLAAKSHNRARAHLITTIGSAPWAMVKFGKTH